MMARTNVLLATMMLAWMTVLVVMLTPHQLLALMTALLVILTLDRAVCCHRKVRQTIHESITNYRIGLKH
jgi:hypothetical protein